MNTSFPTPCEWCANPNATETTTPESLCDDHTAEYEGISLDQLQSRDQIQYAEYLDTLPNQDQLYARENHDEL